MDILNKPTVKEVAEYFAKDHNACDKAYIEILKVLQRLDDSMNSQFPEKLNPAHVFYTPKPIKLQK